MAVSHANVNEKLKLGSVIGAILDEEARRRVSGTPESSCSALNVEARGRDNGKGKSKHQSRGKSRGPNPNGYGEGKCFNCGMEGDFARYCRKPKVEKDSDGSANVAYQTDYEALLLSLEDKVDAWVIDSRALFHATSKRELLDSYVKNDLGTVYLGDDELCTISEKGDGELRLETLLSPMLNDIQHVQRLRQNLI